MSAFFYTLYYKFFALFSAVLMVISPSFNNVITQMETDKQNQITHIEELKAAYASGEKTAIDENSIFDGSLAELLDNGVKFNEITFLGTHNSYQRYHKEDKGCGLTEDGAPITLSDQLDSGLRSLEIDIETVKDSSGMHFVCMHSPLLDSATNCYSFEKALEELAVWSDNNPGHLPLTIIIEPKAVFVPLENMEFFSLNAANALDGVLRNVLGDKLLTPSDVMGDYASLKEMREANAWPEVKDILGKIAVILHPCKVTDGYIEQDETIKSQAMFPMLQYENKDKSYASFLLVNDANRLLGKTDSLADGNYMIRTRADLSGSFSSSVFGTASKTIANIISTDYPEIENNGNGKFNAFNGNATVKLTSSH